MTWWNCEACSPSFRRYGATALIGDSILRLVPADAHGLDADILLNNRKRADHDVSWRGLITRRYYTYWPLVDNCASIDTGIFIRIVPCGGDREGAIIIIAYADNAILLSVKLVRFNHPNSFNLWRLTVCRGDCD